jgi:CheY-like chemotaxis protein
VSSTDEKWRILVVDDEEDVHAVTGLALKRRSWKERPFELTGARSGADARRLLGTVEQPFQVALVDVVMETDRAGLDLCEYIRATQPRSTRIILRTGQPGVAPEEQVLNDFDIDYYLAKSEVTQERLYATVRACLRSSLDVATIMTVTDQLQDYVKVIQEDDSLDRLVQSFSDTLGFLEAKFGLAAALFTELAQAHHAECVGPTFRRLEKEGKINLAESRVAAKKKVSEAGEFKPERVGQQVLVPFTFVPRVTAATSEKRKGFLDRLTKFLGGGGGWVAAGCVVLRFEGEVSNQVLSQVIYDLRLFCQNWKLAYQLLCTQKAITDAASGVVW